MRQWWDIKSDNYDTVLFFKVCTFQYWHESIGLRLMMDLDIGIWV